MGEAKAESGCNICCDLYNGCIVWTKIPRCFRSGRSAGSKSALFGVGGVCRLSLSDWHQYPLCLRGGKCF